MLARSHGAIEHELPGMDAVSVETWIACARYGFRDRLGPPGSGHGVGPGAVADDKLASRFPAVALRVDVVLSACVPEEHPLSLLRSAAFAESVEPVARDHWTASTFTFCPRDRGFFAPRATILNWWEP